MKAARITSEVEGYGCCPRCNGDSGFYQTLYQHYFQIHTWDGEADATEMQHDRETVIKCLDCEKPIYPFNN